MEIESRYRLVPVKSGCVHLNGVRQAKAISPTANIDGGSGFDTYFDALKWVIFD